MKRRFFIRRAIRYFLIILVPMVLLFLAFLTYAVTNQQQQLHYSGEMTLEAAAENCSMTIDGVIAQNDLLTGSQRMLMAITRILNNDDISYADSVIMYSLRTALSSMVSGNPTLNRIIVWVGGAKRAFTSDGTGIQHLSAMPDQSWQTVYAGMGAQEETCLYTCEDASGHTWIVLIHKLLRKEGCTVVYIDPARWERSMQSLLHRTNEHLLILNTDGDMLLHVTNDNCDTSFTPDDRAAILAAEPGEWISCGGERFMVSRMTGTNFILVTALPQRTMVLVLNQLNQSFLIILLVNLSVVILLSWLTTRQLTNQMYHIIDMFDDAVHERPVQKPDQKKHRDESDIIMDNIVYMYLKDNALRSKMEEEILRKENAELMALQLQINPHFLYNTLQTIDFAILIGNADKQELSDALHDLSGILKYSLSNPQEPVTLADELDCLRRYADIQRYRFGNRFVMYIEIDESLYTAKVFRMMLQPLVENSMLHGLKGLKERGYIWVRASRKGDRLSISVADSGVGLTEEERLNLLEGINSAEAKSVGLANLNHRLILCYGAASAIHITSVPMQETTFTFEIAYTES